MKGQKTSLRFILWGPNDISTKFVLIQFLNSCWEFSLKIQNVNQQVVPRTKSEDHHSLKDLSSGNHEGYGSESGSCWDISVWTVKVRDDQLSNCRTTSLVWQKKIGGNMSLLYVHRQRGIIFCVFVSCQWSIWSKSWNQYIPPSWSVLVLSVYKWCQTMTAVNIAVHLVWTAHFLISAITLNVHPLNKSWKGI